MVWGLLFFHLNRVIAHKGFVSCYGGIGVSCSLAGGVCAGEGYGLKCGTGGDSPVPGGG